MPESDVLLTFLQSLFSFKQDYILCLLVCEILYAVPNRLRKIPGIRPGWLSVPAGILLYLAMGLYMPMIPAGSLSVALTALVVFLFSILLQWAVLDISAWRALFLCTAAYATQNLALNIYEVAVFLLGAEGWPRMLLKLGLTGLVYAACYFLFAKKCQNRELYLNKLELILLLLTTVFITNFMFSFVSHQYSDLPLLKVPLAICCLLALRVQFGVFHDSSLNREKEVLEQMLVREQEQHQLRQETIDMINIKSHDLKKQISLLRQSLGAEADGLIREVESVVGAYNSLVNTGNKNLDLIISEEKLICEKHRIPFDVMADGAAVAFIQPVDLYSLVGNALRNAVENSLKEDPQHRSIYLDIHAVNGYACLEIANYCTQQIRFVNGFPVTSKKDARFHGYGTKSMKYIVEKYGGNMVIHYQDHLFQVKIILPLHRQES